jgi:hypothetical protein
LYRWSGGAWWVWQFCHQISGVSEWNSLGDKGTQICQNGACAGCTAMPLEICPREKKTVIEKVKNKTSTICSSIYFKAQLFCNGLSVAVMENMY